MADGSVLARRGSIPEPSPVALVQNPAFGASLLWTFGINFQKEAPGDLAPLHSFFLVLPLVLHAPTLAQITATLPSSGLSKFVSKFDYARERHYAIHTRTVAMRDLSLEAIGAALAARLMSLDYDSSFVRANKLDKFPKPPERLKNHVSGAAKLGMWFSRLPQSQVFSLLRVEP